MILLLVAASHPSTTMAQAGYMQWGLLFIGEVWAIFIYTACNHTKVCYLNQSQLENQIVTLSELG
jgi:hypothetical protein